MLFILFIYFFSCQQKMNAKVTTTQENDPYKGEREGKLREVGKQAVWSLSSCKPGLLSQRLMKMLQL